MRDQWECEWLVRFAWAAALACVTACGGGGTPTTAAPAVSVLATLSVSVSRDSIRVGENALATAAGADAGGRPARIGAPAWSSSAPGVATVSLAGVVSAVAAGSASITASVGTVSASVSIRVTAAPAAGWRVIVDPTEGALTVGHTLQLLASLLDPANVPVIGRPVLWSSTATGVATVSSEGVVTARQPGTAIILADVDGLLASAPITVTGSFDPGVVVTIERPATNALVADTLSVVATVRPEAGVASAVARVGTNVRTLTEQPAGPRGAQLAWVGTVDLADLHFGLYWVVVVATDIHGARGADSVLFERDPLNTGGGSHTGAPRLKDRRRAPPTPVAPRPRPSGPLP